MSEVKRRRMQLYTAFHANLDFSALPEADRPVVISRCYWPILDLAEDAGIPLGFELSARTLRALQLEDPEWVKRFRGLAEQGLVEVIASGWAQLVAPLVPVEVNRTNLLRGRDLYRSLLGFDPTTYFVSEQTYSDGLVDLYCEVGAERLIMEWNNPASHRPELRSLRCRPVRLYASSGVGPVLLWNDSVVFQKMQRIAHGEIPFAELDALLARLVELPNAESLCIYGGDAEIFDYRPSRPVANPMEGAREVDILKATITRLAKDARFEFVLPREIGDVKASLPEVSLGCAAEPIPCKKQPKYNPTRWAVSGRDGFGMNTRCHALLQEDRAARRISDEFCGVVEDLDLIELWRSDFRTRATQEKIVEFDTRMGVAREIRQARLRNRVPDLGEGEDVLVMNPGAEAWTDMPVEVPVRFASGVLFAARLRRAGGECLDPATYQLEIHGRHRDGSVRDGVLVLLQNLAPGEVLRLVVEPAAPEKMVDPGADRGILLDPGEDEIDCTTEQASVRLLGHRGGALEAACFPSIAPNPLLGTIVHGHFDDIAFTPDFYSGHAVTLNENGQRVTDLKRAEFRLLSDSTGPVRDVVEASLETSHGRWRKEIRVYHALPRLDVIHDLAFHDARLASLRLGAFTLLPESWDASSLRYGTVNGGADVEWRELGDGVSVSQSRAVSNAVTAHSCLGATEGWVAFEDKNQGLVISGDRAEAAVAPLLDYQVVDDQFFCRLSHTAAESDETRATFLRGRERFGFSVEAYSAADPSVLGRARIRHEGLIYRTEAGVGLTIGL